MIVEDLSVPMICCVKNSGISEPFHLACNDQRKRRGAEKWSKENGALAEKKIGEREV